MAGYTRVTDTGLQRARAGKVGNYWANHVTPGATEVVLTDAGLIYNLQPNEQVVIAGWVYGVNTNSDDCCFELGFTDQANGAGTFTPLTHCFDVKTGAAGASHATYSVMANVPIVLKYGDGVRCVTFRVDANDASCDITVGWYGWTEEETSYPGDV